MIVHVDLALLDLEALLLEFLGNIGVRHGSVKRVVLADLAADGDSTLSSISLQLFGVVLLLGFLA